ncbi:MAG: SGNH/GDSL hydrolase family protein [Chloroflexota bacterium]
MTAQGIRTEPWRLVTLGDSFTEGTGVERRDSWPRQLVRAMRRDVRLRLVANLADVNKTSEYVLEDQLPQVASLRPDVVSLLIGANDIIAPGVSLDDYERNIAGILDTLLLDLAPEQIFVITTPDYTLAVRGGDFGPREEVRRAVAEANAVLTAAAEERGIMVVDISPVSDRVPLDPTLVASDQLHPSAKQYAGWVEIIAPQLERILQGDEP